MEVFGLFCIYLIISWIFHVMIIKAKTSLNAVIGIFLYWIVGFLYLWLAWGLLGGGRQSGFNDLSWGDPSPFFLLILCLITGSINTIVVAARRKW